MYAVVLTGGKQYKVSEGDVIDVEKLDVVDGDTVELTELMKVDGDTVVTSDCGKATAKVVKAFGKGRKVVVFKYKAKKNERRKNGHRQPFTRLEIISL